MDEIASFKLVLVEYKVLLIDKNLALRAKLGQCTTILFPDQTLQHVASKTI